ncbi:hypothetical protein ACLIIZ_03235 [Azonexus caeni]|uniref:hypothetical protein n=1 Tax=Azonexus caeni TaxID=266126 RepID=UPI003A87A3EB
MKERPILFSALMVRAILGGRKTQTRRVVKPIPQMVTNKSIVTWDGDAAYLMRLFDQVGRSCPYGHPGDRLWVREATHRRPMLNLLTGEPLAPEYDGGAYTADGEDVQDSAGFDFVWWYSRKSCPSIHMPRWASRILLEITAVRVERLHDISEADAMKEGAEPVLVPPDGGSCPHAEGFRELWESINGAGSWGADPWVWVVEFKRLEGGS